MPTHGPPGDPHGTRQGDPFGDLLNGLVPAIGSAISGFNTATQPIRNFFNPVLGLGNFLGGSPIPTAPERANFTPSELFRHWAEAAAQPAPPVGGTLLRSNNLQDQYLKASAYSTGLNVLQHGSKGLSQSGVWGPTFRGLQYGSPTSSMRAFEASSGLQGAAQTLARQAGTRAIPSPFLWLVTPGLMDMFRRGAEKTTASVRGPREQLNFRL